MRTFTKTAILVVTLFLNTWPCSAAEPVKRQTALEIYGVLLDLPYGAGIDQIVARMGAPVEESSNYIAYKHSRTGTFLIIYKSPFNTAQSAQILEECISPADAEARCVLITEQFNRRFGEPYSKDGGITIWKIESIGILAVYIDPERAQIVNYRLEPFPG